MLTAAHRRLAAGACALALLSSRPASADDFAAGSLIVPMDTTYQDMGMLEAYGLVYALLKAGVPVRWVIAPQKQNGGVDFVADAVDLESGAQVAQHGYRGGPWVVDAADVPEAMPVVEAWLQANPNTTVHEATAAFVGPVARVLIAAPTIAMFADGNQKIARKYMMAAKIPDSTGDPLWPDTSPDMLTPEEVAGPTDSSHNDGALFDEDGHPVYCQLMSMHWGVGDAQKLPEVVAEVREYLTNPVHFFAECQAVNAFENLAPHGFFLTTKGFLIGTGPKMYDYSQMDSPYAQIDGPFLSVGGSEPAYSLPPGETYKASDTVMITEKGTPIGVNDVWMTGVLDGVCPKSGEGCLTKGKVSYLGGHEYSVSLPISANPQTQGTRLFLNSLFEAPCATADGAPSLMLTKAAPAVVDAPQVTFTLTYQNIGTTTALEASIHDDLPPNTTFVSASDGGVLDGNTVTWPLGNLGPGENGVVELTVDLGGEGLYENTARLDYRVGLNLFTLDSNKTATAYGDVPAGTSTSGVPETTGEPATTAPEPTGGGTGGGTGALTSTSGEPTTGVPPGPTGGSTGDSAGGTGGEGDASGCACRDTAPSPPLALLLLAGLSVRRRPRARTRAAHP